MERHIITDAGVEDIPELQRIEAECDLSPWTRGGYELEFKRSDSVLLKAKGQDGRIIGFIVGRVPLGEGEAEIYNLGIAPVFRRKGVASSLIRKFKAVCENRSIAAIWLEVRASNDGAISFYKAHGFGQKGIRTKFYSDPEENAVLMCMSLR